MLTSLSGFYIIFVFLGHPWFGQGHAILGRVQRPRGDSEKYAYVIASRGRAAEPGNSRQTLATASHCHQSQLLDERGHYAGGSGGLFS